MSEFLAEAAVLIRADTTAFRAQLLAEVNAAVAAAQAAARPVVIPVAATGAAQATQQIQRTSAAAVAGANAASAALGGQTQSTAAAAASAKRLTIQHDNIAKTNRRLAAASDAYALSQRRVVGASSQAAAASITFSRAQRAVQRANLAVESAARSGVASQKVLANQLLATARAYEVQALAALEAARAGRTAGASQAFAARGAGAALLSFAGLRGAVLSANSAFLAGTVGALAFGKAVQTAASFESEINVFRVTTGATATEMERVAESARALGRDITLPGVAATDAAQAMSLLARAGLDVNDAVDATRGVLQLGTAAQIDNAAAVQLTASALNAFGLAGNQAVRVADILANSANASQGSITDMGIALQQSSAAANLVGLSLQDTATFLTLLAKAGIQGSDAGTSLRVALTRLINPTDEAQALLNKLVGSVRDMNGNIKPEIFFELAEAMSGMTKQQQQQNAAVIFGVDGLRTYATVANAGRATFSSVSGELERQGTAAEVAGARMAGLAGAAENLKNQLSALGQTVGESVTPFLTDMAEGFAEIVSNANTAIEVLIEFRNRARDAFPDDQESDGGFFGRLEGTARDFFTGTVFDQAKQFRDQMVEMQRQLEEMTGLDLVNDAALQADEFGKNLGAETRSAIEDAGREGAAGARDFGDQIINNLNAAFNAAEAAVAAAAGKLRNAQIRAVRQSQGQQLGLEEIFNRIVAGGDNPRAQLANLRRQAEIQRQIISEAGPGAAGVQLEARRDAQAKVASINSQIRSISEQMADDMVRARNEADQRLLDSISAGRTAAARRLERARATEEAGDDIPALLAYRKQIENEIRQVSTGVRDAKARTQQLDRLADELFQNSLDLQAAREKRDDAIQASVEERRTALRSIAETTGNTALLIRVLDQEIADARQVLARARAAREGQLAARAALLELQKERRDTINEARAGLLEDAFRLAEARGNKSAMLQILDLRIKQARLEIRQARTLRERIGEQIELQELINQRREILEEKTKETDKGTTAFDLLQSAAETFRQNAGSLIGGAQPFAGPTGFTADLSQFLRRQRGTGIAQPSATADKTQQAAAAKQTNELIAALRDLTNATLGASGNSSTATKTARGPIARNDRAHYHDATQARRVVERRSGI